MPRIKGVTQEMILTRTEKPCATCEVVKPLSEYHKTKRSLDGHKGECKLCRSERGKRSYVQGSRKASVQARYQKHRLIIEDAKDQPCADCNVSYPSPVMHFHHRDPSTKIASVASLVGSTEETLRAEISKCDVLCANCHILRHHFGL